VNMLTSVQKPRSSSITVVGSALKREYLITKRLRCSLLNGEDGVGAIVHD